MDSSQSTASSTVSTATTSVAGSSSSLSPEILAAIRSAVEQSFNSRLVPGLSGSNTSSTSSTPSAIPASQPHVPLASGGMSFPVVPSFISSFSSAPPAGTGIATTTIGNAFTASTTGALSASVVSPLLYKPFVIGPGYSPVPAKLVSQILAGKYIDLNDLLPANLLPISADSEPQLMLDGRLVLTSQPKKPKRRLEDIVSWIEAFSVYTMVLTAYYPHRWRDLLSYKLLIIRTYRNFTGKAWLNYDQAFREHAAAMNITDWSQINVQLYHYQTAGSASRQASVCRSWNRGHCSSPYSSCCYSHKCAKCSGQHKEIECPQSTSSSSSRQREHSPTQGDGSRRKYHKA